MEPPEEQRCDGYIPSYRYNYTTFLCDYFIYGGCEGNDNMFNSSEECETYCNGVGQAWIKARASAGGLNISAEVSLTNPSLDVSIDGVDVLNASVNGLNPTASIMGVNVLGPAVSIMNALSPTAPLSGFNVLPPAAPLSGINIYNYNKLFNRVFKNQKH